MIRRGCASAVKVFNVVMNILYLSPSMLPSRSANSIHVIRMCEAFSHLGHTVLLVCGRSIRSSRFLKLTVERYYGVELKRVKLLSFYWPFSKGLNSMLGLFSFFWYVLLRMKKWTPDVIVSRNLYAAFFLQPFISKGFFFETHHVERGWRNCFQRKLVRKKGLHTIVISQALADMLREQTGCRRFYPLVLHDAAPKGIEPLSPETKMRQRAAWFGEKLTGSGRKKVAGYFGHLYPGRGVDLIRELAHRHPDIVFVIFGGNEAHIRELRTSDPDRNFMVMGYIPAGQVIDVMRRMDILLMPYQTTVSIGDNRADTSRYLSPMKMFEYMACGVPIIASDLPSVREILVDGHNCLLAPPTDVNTWSRCLVRVCDDDDLAQTIGQTAYSEYTEKYNWDLRASRIIQAAKNS